jgi:hypothetical protein
VQVAGPVLAVAVLGGKIVGPSRPVLPPGWLSPQGREAARLVCLCRVQMAQAIHLWAVPQACLSDRAAVVHLV